MKKNKEFMKRMIWLTAGFLAAVHFLTAQAGGTDQVQDIVTNMKVDIDPGEYISIPMPLKSIISVFMPFNTGY